MMVCWMMVWMLEEKKDGYLVSTALTLPELLLPYAYLSMWYETIIIKYRLSYCMLHLSFYLLVPMGACCNIW